MLIRVPPHFIIRHSLLDIRYSLRPVRLDHRRPGEMELRQQDDSDQVMPSDAALGVEDQVSDDDMNDDEPGTP